jgi:hypothetical protein
MLGRSARESTWQRGTARLKHLIPMEVGDRPVFVSFTTTWQGHGTASRRRGWCGGRGRLRHVPCSLYPSYRPIQSESFLLFLTGSFSAPGQPIIIPLTNSTHLVTLNGACGRSHAIYRQPHAHGMRMLHHGGVFSINRASALLPCPFQVSSSRPSTFTTA